MQNIIKITIMLLLFFGCSSKEPQIVNEPSIDKKTMFNLSSLSIETGHGYIGGDEAIAQLLSREAQKRADESIYFTKFKKGILKLKLLEVSVVETKTRKGSFLFVFPSYEKGYSAKIVYTLTAHSPSGDELQKSEQRVSVSVKSRAEESKQALLHDILDKFQESIYKTGRGDLAQFTTK